MKPSFVAFIALAAGCAGSPGPVAPAQADTGARAEALRPAGGMLVPSAPTYIYNPVGKRDPFVDPENDGMCHLRPISMRECFTALCDYELDQLRLTGIISGDGKPVGVIEAPNGQAYAVSVGTRVGPRAAVVKAIRRDSVVLAEPGDDGRSSEIVLRLPADPPPLRE